MWAWGLQPRNRKKTSIAYREEFLFSDWKGEGPKSSDLLKVAKGRTGAYRDLNCKPMSYLLYESLVWLCCWLRESNEKECVMWDPKYVRSLYIQCLVLRILILHLRNDNQPTVHLPGFIKASHTKAHVYLMYLESKRNKHYPEYSHNSPACCEFLWLPHWSCLNWNICS